MINTNIKIVHKRIINVGIVAIFMLMGYFLCFHVFAATPTGKKTLILKDFKTVTLNTTQSTSPDGSTRTLFQTTKGDFVSSTKTTFKKDGTPVTRAASYLGSDQNIDGTTRAIASKKAQQAIGDLFNKLTKKLELNTDGCSLVTPGQSTNYGNMFGEHGVAKEAGGLDAFGEKAIKGVQSDINKRLMDADLGYLRKEDFEIAKQAPALQAAVAKHQKSTAEWAGWAGETPLPTAENAKEHLDTPGGGYHTKGGSKMRPSAREAGKGGYIKGRTYNTTDGGYAKVTDDCSFVASTKEDWDKWQQSNQKAANPGATSSLIPNNFVPAVNNVGAGSSMVPSVTNAFSNLLPFSFNLVNSLSSSIFSLLST